MQETQPLERKRNVSLEKLFELVTFGNRDEDVLSSIAARLARLDRELTPNDRTALAETAHGQSLADIKRIYGSRYFRQGDEIRIEWEDGTHLTVTLSSGRISRLQLGAGLE